MLNRRLVFSAFAAVFLLSVVLGGFTPSVAAETVRGYNGNLELSMTIENTTIEIGDWVNINLTLKNIGSSTKLLTFGSSQVFDMYLYDENNQLVCSLSDGKYFLALFWYKWLYAGETMGDPTSWNFYKHTASGYVPPAPGNYSLVGVSFGDWYSGAPMVTTPKLPITLVLDPTGPTANFTYSPAKPVVNGTVTFNASSSLPGWNGTHLLPIINYTWDFGDENITTVADPVISHSYAAVDNYTVTLNVTTDQDFWNTTSKQITISAPYGPTANFTYTPPDPTVNSTVTFDASHSLPGWNGDDVPIVNYTWDFGDGNTTTTSNPIITHEYTRNDTYAVTLNATDAQGFWNTTSKNITIRVRLVDIAITNVDVYVNPSKAAYSSRVIRATQCYPTWGVSYKVNVTVTNEGDYAESFTVTLFLQNSTGNYTQGTKAVNSLAAGASVNVTFTFAVPPLKGYAGPGSGPQQKAWPYPTYTVWANASVVSGETNTTNNAKAGLTIKVVWPGDVNADGKVDYRDLFYLARSWAKNANGPYYQGTPATLGRYDYRADFNMDGAVGTTDLFILAKNWGKGPLGG